MKITIGEKSYKAIKNLSFAPETDITGGEVAVNQFTADIMTSDNISVGGNALLYDDRNNLWAKYWLTEAVRKDKKTVSIIAQSVLKILDRTKMEPVMYSGTSVASILSSIFRGVGSVYTVDSSFAAQTVSGYCPEQTARVRLQWVCFCIGAYVKTFFSDKIEILPIDESLSAIPMERTFWKPSITYGDYVTAVKATAYTYTQGTPQTTDEWVQVGETYYIQTSQDFELTNPDVPATANENVVSVEDVTIIGQGNVSGILTNLSKYYFKRIEVDADVINNAEYAPGERVSVNTDDETIIGGYIKSADFTFGLQARSKIKLVQTDAVESASLTIIGLYNGAEISRRRYNFPVGYSYTIENPFVDQSKGLVRFIYRPLNESASGTVAEGGTTDNENYDVALRYAENRLTIYSVDEVEQNNDVVRIS